MYCMVWCIVLCGIGSGRDGVSSICCCRLVYWLVIMIVCCLKWILVLNCWVRVCRKGCFCCVMICVCMCVCMYCVVICIYWYGCWVCSGVGWYFGCVKIL